MPRYHYLIVGAGLFGSTFAFEARKRGKSCLVIDKRDHIGGNIFTEEIEGIQVHKYGAHIFHTSNKTVWDFVNQIVPFNRFTNSPIANYKGELYNLPFNMNTFHQLWGVTRPSEAQAIIEKQRELHFTNSPQNLEEQAINLVGTDIYHKLIKGYTEKQWGRPCQSLPAFIIQRLPVRFTFDNNYFNDTYQGIPIGGYTRLIAELLSGTEVRLATDFLQERQSLSEIAEKVVYTGPIDEFFQYQFGRLEYRSLRFENELLAEMNFQGNAVVNYTDAETPYTRIIEHKHFDPDTQATLPSTYITKEFPANWAPGDEPYYPVNDSRNQKLFAQYQELSTKVENTIFGGRLAEYKYYDMDDVIEKALALVKKEFPSEA